MVKNKEYKKTEMTGDIPELPTDEEVKSSEIEEAFEVEEVSQVIPQQRFKIVAEYPTVPIKKAREKDGTIINYILVEDAEEFLNNK